jgi:stage V sporulation protein D (sporulation-specific penicillin-binding protein)
VFNLIVENIVNKAQIPLRQRAFTVLMNPNSGDILAMAQTPSFDLNDVPRDDLTLLFSSAKNNMVSSVIEPGSTFKILTTAIALEEGVVTETDKFYCRGSKIVDGKKIKCWKSKGHGSETFAEGVKNSCNVVFMECALRIGTVFFYEYLNTFGLNFKYGN